MELILNIKVRIIECISTKGADTEIVMISFDGTAKSKYFCGKVIGTGVDTQRITNEKTTLSARYMLEGVDSDNKQCRIFIENNSSEKGYSPKIVTDSKKLSFLEKSDLSAEILPIDNGVNVLIYLNNMEILEVHNG